MIPTRIGWAAVAIAGASTAFVAVTLLNHVDEGTDRTGALTQHLTATPPATSSEVRELGRQVDELATAVPTAVPTLVITAAPGPAGASGPAGPAGPPGAPGRPGPTITLAPAPAFTRSAQPQPAAPPSSSTPAPSSSSTPTPCTVAAFLAGVCVQRDERSVGFVTDTGHTS